MIAKAENFQGAFGVMADDWVAAVYVIIILLMCDFLGLISYSWFPW